MSEQFDGLIAEASGRYGVPFEWIKAIIATESGFNPSAYNPEGSYGLMQILDSTARALGFTGPLTELFNPALNIELGTRLLAEDIIPRCGSDFAAVYSAYNSGRCELYQSSAEVARNVERALSYLSDFARGPAMVPAAMLLLVAFLMFRKKGKR